MATDFRIKEELGQLTDRLVDSYLEHRSINYLGHCPLPNVADVVSIVSDVKELLFPGYRRRQHLHMGNVTYFVGDMIDSLHDRLTQQIARAVRYGSDTQHSDCCETEKLKDFEMEGQRQTVRFLESLPELRRLLATDVQAAFDGDPAASGLDEIIFCYPGLEAISSYRIAHQLFRQGVPLIPRMISEDAHKLTGIDIHPGAKIGPSFFIDHGTGVVIGATCEIGSRVKIYQGVTLGALSFAKDEDGNLVRGSKRHPTIDDDVVIYANATVLGGETTVGANCVVGASVSLTRTIPPYTVVTIEKPQLRFRDLQPKPEAG
ncbi:Serine acetyltransferase [Caulifigura coniformis]|uniref:Serine acetyltransferase n=1 Tax=Caulifigura coniformis TaxID=2527983 RepID=A0A517SJ01_9PLAN|nr:serine acetyltransferase [Caulifigura coniformis]QDT56100.1 Serine acetyltransferase [Caulifigura coniformis]